MERKLTRIDIPWCNACQEKECHSTDSDCAMIRIYQKAKEYARSPALVASDREGFVRGIVWAAGFIASDHNNQTYAMDIFYQSGITQSEAVKFNCEYDLKRLRRAIPELPVGKE